MSNEPVPLCKPPQITVCENDACHCLTPPQPAPAQNACIPPLGLQCFGQQCFCMQQPQPAVVHVGPPAPGDECAIAMTLVMAGVKKLLMTCWVTP